MADTPVTPPPQPAPAAAVPPILPTPHPVARGLDIITQGIAGLMQGLGIGAPIALQNIAGQLSYTHKKGEEVKTSFDARGGDAVAVRDLGESDNSIQNVATRIRATMTKNSDDPLDMVKENIASGFEAVHQKLNIGLGIIRQTLTEHATRINEFKHYRTDTLNPQLREISRRIETLEAQLQLGDVKKNDDIELANLRAELEALKQQRNKEGGGGGGGTPPIIPWLPAGALAFAAQGLAFSTAASVPSIWAARKVEEKYGNPPGYDAGYSTPGIGYVPGTEAFRKPGEEEQKNVAPESPKVGFGEGELFNWREILGIGAKNVPGRNQEFDPNAPQGTVQKTTPPVQPPKKRWYDPRTWFQKTENKDAVPVPPPPPPPEPEQQSTPKTDRLPLKEPQTPQERISDAFKEVEKAPLVAVPPPPPPLTPSIQKTEEDATKVKPIIPTVPDQAAKAEFTEIAGQDIDLNKRDIRLTAQEKIVLSSVNEIRIDAERITFNTQAFSIDTNKFTLSDSAKDALQEALGTARKTPIPYDDTKPNLLQKLWGGLGFGSQYTPSGERIPGALEQITRGMGLIGEPPDKGGGYPGAGPRVGGGGGGPGGGYFGGYTGTLDPYIPAAQTGPTGIDRSKFAEELKAKPWLKEKLIRLSLGENRDPLANQSVMEETMNRAAVRGTSLEEAAKIYGVEKGGYSAGFYRGQLTPEQIKMTEANLKSVLEGSNVSRGATDNSSGGLAQRELQGGQFTLTFNRAGEYFWTRNSEQAKYAKWVAENEQRRQKQLADKGIDTTKQVQSSETATRVEQSQGRMAAVRKGELRPELTDKLDYAATQTGVKVQVLSGGQDPYGAHKGGYRHDYGGAGDVKLYTTDNQGRRIYLNPDNPDDKSKIEKFIYHAKRAGVQGIGYGRGYMEPGEIHLDISGEGMWGASRTHETIDPGAARAIEQAKRAGLVDIEKWKEAQLQQTQQPSLMSRLLGISEAQAKEVIPPVILPEPTPNQQVGTRIAPITEPTPQETWKLAKESLAAAPLEKPEQKALATVIQESNKKVEELPDTTFVETGAAQPAEEYQKIAAKNEAAQLQNVATQAWAKIQPTEAQKAETTKIWEDVNKQRKDDGSYPLVGEKVTEPIPHLASDRNVKSLTERYGPLGSSMLGHNPEGRGPQPGSDGYGDLKENPDNSTGICMV